jgi:hypothetical protein
MLGQYYRNHWNTSSQICKIKVSSKGRNTFMSRLKLILGIVLTIILLVGQVGGVLAAPLAQDAPPIHGTVQGITLESDPATGVMTVIVDVMDSNQSVQQVRLTQKTAIALGLVLLDGDGNLIINKKALVKTIEIDPSTAIPEQKERQHPVANALATFFSDIEGIDYDTIMAAHENGVGFGVIAQALWLASELGGNSQLFQDLLYAKEHNDYSAFGEFTEDGTTPKSWGQLRKALLINKSLGLVMSNHDNNGTQGNSNNSNGNGNGTNKDKDKTKDKSNNRNSNGNGHNK